MKAILLSTALTLVFPILAFADNTSKPAVWTCYGSEGPMMLSIHSWGLGRLQKGADSKLYKGAITLDNGTSFAMDFESWASKLELSAIYFSQSGKWKGFLQIEDHSKQAGIVECHPD